MERYLALGDSYTIGEGVAEKERFPEQLCAVLRQRGRDVDAPRLIARTGWTTDELAAAITADQPPGTFDFVTLLIGVNDQYRGRAPEAYRLLFRALLKQAVSFAGGDARRVMVISIPDWCATPFAAGQGRSSEGALIDQFNAVNRAEALAVGAPYADVTEISRRAARDRSLLAQDGLHPSGQMYALWVEVILPLVPAPSPGE
ncbi:MAG: lysophospholipase [Chloracidobacterium sp. CP2_5A]|nr:MAG: lysophospholipase [Chloracidobacterium sp. CP2_5A]